MNMRIMPCTGAVLAGGRSSRMMQAKDSMVMPDGRTMLKCVIDALRTHCPRVVIVGRQGSDQRFGCDSITDLRPHAGPLGGIEALLASGVDPTGQYLICPCDVPLITPELLELLLTPTDARATVFRVEQGGGFEPLPARLCAVALPSVRESLQTQHQSMWRLMQALSLHVIPITAQQSMALRNVNSPVDFEEASRMARSRH